MSKTFPSFRVPVRLGLLLLLLSASTLFGAEFYVSPTAAANGNGTFNSPWKLQTALDHPSAVHPGDTIWLRGGTTTPRPTRAAWSAPRPNPIIVRQYPGERARIDGNYNGNEVTLTSTASTPGSGTSRSSTPIPPASPPSGAPPRRGTAVHLSGDGTRMINMVVHDTSQGVLTGEAATDARIYGTPLLLQRL